MRLVTQGLVARTCGSLLLLLGAAGLVPNPLFGPGAMLETTRMLSLVHLFTGALGLAIGLTGHEPPAKFINVALGLTYGALTALGFAFPTVGANLLALSGPLNVVHLALGGFLLGFGVAVREAPAYPVAP